MQVGPRIVFCPNCNAQKSPEETYCPNCGARSCPNGHTMSPNSRICTQCGWEDRAFKAQRERPAGAANPPKSALPQAEPIGFTCPICHSKSGISAGRCNTCGNLIETANYGHLESSSADISAAQEHFRVRQQHPGTHDAKLSYACPRCTARLDPSSGRCPNCGYMGSMEYEIPQSQTVTTPNPPPPQKEAPAPPPTQHTVSAQHYHRTSSTQTCPSCQANISTDSRICPYCGSPCGPGRSMFAGAGKKTTLERAYESAASSSYQSYEPVPIPRSTGYHPEPAETFTGRAGRIPIEDRMQPREKKKKQRKEKVPKEYSELSETPERRKFPMGLLIAVIIVAVALVGMVIFVLVQEFSSPGVSSSGTPTLTEDDTIAPIITNIKVTDIKSSSVVVNWTTDERASSEVKICDAGEESCTFADDDSLVKQHSLKVPNLEPGMEYHVTIWATDEDGNTEEVVWSETFTTSGEPGTSGGETVPPGIEQGDLALDFTLQDTDGVSRALSDYRGDIVILNFWQTTCGPCMEELPYIEEVYSNWSGDIDMVVLAINSGEAASNFIEVIDPYKFTFVVLEDRFKEVTETYNVNKYPTTYFIDPEGVILGVRQGSFDSPAEFEDALNSYNW